MRRAPRAPTPARAHGAGPKALLAGLRETLLVLASFLVLGLSAAGLERAALSSAAEQAAAGPGPSYPRDVEPAVERCETPRPAVWLVDGFNVLCTALLGGRDRSGWWSEERRAELLARAAHFAEPAELWVVFDGAQPAPEGCAAGGVHAVFAPSADAWLLRRLREHPGPEVVVVVTADRRLAERARRRGARIVSPHRFLASCPEPPGPASTS